MSDNKYSLIPDNAITEIGKEIYSDVGHPVFKEVGNIGSSLMKFIALPFKFLGMTADELEKKYSVFLEKTIQKIPKENYVVPRSVIVAPLLDHVKFIFNEEGISEMFSNLLANAMNANIEKLVHPAFVEMLKQMSPLDVEFMNLYFKDRDLREISCLDWERGETQKALAVDSLSRLGIINSASYDDKEDVAIMLTDFGALFRDLCMMTPTENETIGNHYLEDVNNTAIYDLDSRDIGFIFQDMFCTARKSKTNGRIYVRERFQIQDVKNGSDIIICLRINNIGKSNKIIHSARIECNDYCVSAENEFPKKILPGKYSDFIFSVDINKDLLSKAAKSQSVFVVQIFDMVYELPITNQTKEEIGLFLKYK